MGELHPNEAHKTAVEVLRGRLASCKEQLEELAKQDAEAEVRKKWQKIFANDWWAPEERALTPASPRKVNVTYEIDGRIHKYDPLVTPYIPSGAKISFKLEQPLGFGETVNWIVKNDGDEATFAGDANERPGKLNATGDGCVENAKYKGEHEMRCIVSFQGRQVFTHSIPVRIRHFPVVVKYWNQFKGGSKRRRRPF